MCCKGMCSLSHRVCIDLWVLTLVSVKWFLKAEFPRSMLVLGVAGKAVCKTDPTGSARASALAVVGLCAQLPKSWV